MTQFNDVYIRYYRDDEVMGLIRIASEEVGSETYSVHTHRNARQATNNQIPISIDPSHKSMKASDKYPKLHHFVTEMCTHVHIYVTKCCIVEYGTDAFWNL